MPVDAPETVNLIARDGSTIPVPADQVAQALANGFTVESQQHAAARLAGEAKAETYGGVGGTLGAAGLGAARGLTFGLSDVGLGAVGMGEELAGLQEVNPLASTIGEVGGALAGGFAAPGSLLARTPAGLTTRLGVRVAGLGEEAGAIARTTYRAGGAALEGAAQNAGAYVSDVALGNRELSADAFMGAMGRGALWGGVAGGALSVASDSVIAARRLFPRQEITREAVQGAEELARREVSGAVQDGETLAQAARDRLRQIRADRAALDLDTKVKLDGIAVREAEALAASRAAKAEAQAERARVQLERAKAPGRRTRKALQEEAAGEEAIGATRAASTTPSPAAAEIATDATTLLERQLGAMKQGVDAGATLADLAAQRPPVIGLKPTHVEDALNAEIAKIDPEAARLVKGLQEIDGANDALGQWLGKYQGGKVERFERAEATRAYAEGMRPKEAGYYTKVPEGEGDMLLPRGRQSVFRGSEAERQIADARTMSKLAPEEQLAADDAVAEMFARRERQSIGEAVAEGRPPPDIDAQVQGAVRSKVDSIDDDIAQSADAIGRHEAASAELADALGQAAPSSAQARAAAFREAQRGAESATVEAGARATAEAERAAETIALGAVPPRGRLGGLLGKAQDIGTAAEAMRALGIDVPDPRSIPVIGPVLGMYLKARLLAKTFGRFGGKVAETAESTIASKAAQTKQRIYAAVDTMLEGGAKITAQAAKRGGGAAAALGHVLFDDGEPKAKAYSSQAPNGSLPDLYLARAGEVTRALKPGAIEQSIRARIKTSAPAILDAIVAAQTRKLEFLDGKMPKPSEPPVPTQIRMPWVPSKAEIAQWGRYVEAAEDPVGVIEAAANGGHVTVEAVETLKTVYPELFADAQLRILQRAQEQTDPIPYARRVQLSVMFDMPFEGSQTPEGAAFLQSSYQAPPPTPPPQQPPMAPTVTANVRFDQRTSPETKAL